MKKNSIGLKDLKFVKGGCFVGLENKRHPTRSISNFELIIVREGKLAMFENQKNFLIQKFQYLVLEPNLQHGGLEDYEPNLSFYWFHFELPKGIKSLPKTGHFKRAEIVADLASRLLDEQDRVDAPIGACDAMMYLLLIECDIVQDINQQDPSGLVDQATLFIQRNYKRPISTRDVAENCHCHPDHLGRVFQSRMHISISNYIREHRLRKACSLLRDTNLSIEMVANQSGFGEAHYFRRCFKTSKGSSPSAWRSMHCRIYKN